MTNLIRRTVSILSVGVLLAMLAVSVLMLAGCAEPVSSSNLALPVNQWRQNETAKGDVYFDQTSKPEPVRVVESKGPNTTKSLFGYYNMNGTWAGTTNADPWMADLSRGNGSVHGSGRFRAFRFDQPNGVTITAVGGDDLRIERAEMWQDPADNLVKFTITGLGAAVSPVEAEITKQVAVQFGEAWTTLTEAEKEVRIEAVRAQVSLGASIKDAVTSVVAKFLVPVP